jgi:acyl carrier protein
MQQDRIEATFADILEEVAKLNRAEVIADKRLREDLGIDSLSLIDLAVAAEDTFGIRIPDEDLERFRTVGDAVDYIRRGRLARLGQCAPPVPSTSKSGLEAKRV